MRGVDSNPDTDNFYLRSPCVLHCDFDILAISESHRTDNAVIILVKIGNRFIEMQNLIWWYRFPY